MKWLACALLIGCGGGPSIPGGDVDPSTRIISSNCQVIGTTVTVDVAYDTTLGVGQAWESEVLVLDGGSGGAPTGETSFFNCSLWTETGSGSSAKGCQRDDPDSPATQNVSHMYSTSFTNQLSPPVMVMFFANTFDSPGGPSIGSGDNDNINCF